MSVIPPTLIYNTIVPLVKVKDWRIKNMETQIDLISLKKKLEQNIRDFKKNM